MVYLPEWRGMRERNTAMSRTHPWEVSDARCKMIDIDPETGAQQPGVLAAIVRELSSEAGVYGSIERPCTVMVGAPVSLLAP